MWASSNDYSLTNIGGERPLGDYTEIQRQIALVYQLAQQLQQNGTVFANIDPQNEQFELGQGDEEAALLYGLKPYIIAPNNQTTVLVPINNTQKAPQLNSNMHRGMLRSILAKIVEDA